MAYNSKFTGAQIDALLDASEAMKTSKEDVANKVTSIGADATDEQYPSAKAVKDLIDSHTFPIINNLTVGGEASALSAEMGKLLNEKILSISLANGEDGKVYIAVNGVNQGNGVNLQTGRVEVWADVITSDGSLTIANGQTAQLGVKLSVMPSQSQTITIASSKADVALSVSSLTFTESNWNAFQFITLTNNYNDMGDLDVTITLTNSDPLLTNTSVFVLAKGISYENLVDTTIPAGAHTVTAADFETVTVVQTKGLGLRNYNAQYTNIFVPKTIEYNGSTYITVLASGFAFKNNTSLQYVEIEDGVKGSEYGTTVTRFDLNGLFVGCTSLIGVKYGGSEMIEMNGMFDGCSSLLFFDGLDRQTNATNMMSVFKSCSSLEYVQDLSALTKITNLQSIFDGCSNLVRILGMPHELISTSVSGATMYNHCSKLTEAIIPKGVNDLFYACRGATSLRKLDVYAESTFKRISSVFDGCSNLKVYCVEGSDAYTQLHTAYASDTTVKILTYGGGELPAVIVWGDSTSSPNTSWNEWPARLQTKIGASLEVKNQAVSGEYTTSTSARQGGNALSVGAFEIPATTDAVQIVLKSADNQTFGTNPVFSAGASFNPCTISGVKGSISQSSWNYYFKRLEAGIAVSVSADTPVTSDQDALFNNADAIMLVLIGCNSGWNGNASTLLNQVNLMVQHFVAAGGTKYIIAGAFSGKFMRTEADRDEIFAFETLAATQFGNNWLNLRQYLIANGLTENNLTATASDTERMALGQVPGSLLGGGTPSNIVMYPSTSSDDTHPNAYGANSMMLAFFHKGVSLGYWSDNE